MNDDQNLSSEQLHRRQEVEVVPGQDTLRPDSSFVTSVKLGLQLALEQAQELMSANSSASLFNQPINLLIGISGGPDSTSLLGALIALSQSLPLKITACHINHQQRGAESKRDEQFCQKLCAAWKIPLEVCQLTDLSKSESEEALRTARFNALSTTATDKNITYIVLGHTLDDQSETALFRLFRGTGYAGLMGMQPARKLTQQLVLLRPMLNTTKHSCSLYLESIGLKPTQDSSNYDLSYTRNYLRHKVLPVIAEKFPAFQKHLLQLRKIVAADNEYLSELTKLAQTEVKKPNTLDETWDLHIFNQKPLAIKRRLITLALQSFNIEVTFKKVETITEMCSKMNIPALSLNENLVLNLLPGLLVWSRIKPKEKTQGSSAWMINLQSPGLNLLPALGLALKIEKFTQDTWKGDFPSNRSWEATLNLSNIFLPLIARFRAAGDIIQPLGMKESVRLKKYLHTHKGSPDTPPLSWDGLLVIADQKEIIWVPGIGLSDKVKVNKQPTHHLKIVKIANDIETLC